MSLDLLDLLLVAHFCFNAEVPWWLWVLGTVAMLSNGVRLSAWDKAIKKIAGKA